MSSIASEKDWLEKSIASEYIRFYPYDGLTDKDCVGHGAFGIVFKATVTKTGIVVAYKMIKYWSEDEFFKSFVKELRIHRSVDDHPNITRFLGVSKDTRGRYLMVFEYADNGSLRDYLSTPTVKLDWPANCQLCLDIINGLRHIHRAGILHKDLSSNNVLIHGKTAKIADFGTSDLMLQRKTCSDHRGTLAYLDPKCFNNDSNRDDKSDIFSFGILMWEISSREYPCSEFNSILDIQIYRLKGGRHDVVPGTPEGYKNLYTECWNGNSENRPNSQQCYDRLIITLEHLNKFCDQHKETVEDHPLSNKLSSLYHNLKLSGKSEGQVAGFIRNSIIQYSNSEEQKNAEVILKSHTGCGQCFWLIGFFYEHGIETEKSLEQAVQWYQKAAEQGYANAQYNFGICYEDGTGVEKNIQKAVELYQKAAELGIAWAQNSLGICYEDGTGVEKNIQKAVELYQKATEQGNANAQNNLGLCYMKGTGVEKNIQKAVELYQKAAEQGNDWAQNNLGVSYENGTGVEKNIQKAVELYQKAAEQGNDWAQNNLGTCYENGTGVEKNIQKAVELYQKAAEQGNAFARNNLNACCKKETNLKKLFKTIKQYSSK